jgi:M-phase inducer phosphatase
MPLVCKSLVTNILLPFIHSILGADPLLIGDCSKRYVLPILDKGRHTDLKEISADTLVRLIDGHYRNEVSSFLILDCRYPYEYDGGHIRGAENLYTEREVFEKLMEKKSSLPVGSKSSERNILIFHCEFSQERGPRM